MQFIACNGKAVIPVELLVDWSLVNAKEEKLVSLKKTDKQTERAFISFENTQGSTGVQFQWGPQPLTLFP